MTQANNTVATGKKRANSVITVSHDGDKATNVVIPAKKRANSVITVTQGAGVFHFDVIGQPRLTVDMAKVSAENVEYAAYHGIKQRVVDSAAIAWDGIGQRPTPGEKYAEMLKIVEHLNSGSPDWNTVRGEGGGAVGGVTLKALAAVQGMEVDAMRARVTEIAEKQGKTVKAKLAEYATLPDVVKKVAELRAAASPVKADDLMDELNG